MNPLRRPGLPSKEYYNDSERMVSYSKTIALVLEGLLLESKPNVPHQGAIGGCLATNSEDLVRDLVTFETKLAAATPSAEEAEDVTKYYNPRTLEETRLLLPQLSISYIIVGLPVFLEFCMPRHVFQGVWLPRCASQRPGYARAEMLTLSLLQATLAPSGYTTDRIIVGSPSYLTAVTSILKSTSPETLQAYFVWKTVQHYAYKIKDDALKPLLRFNNELQGKDPDVTEERWRTCVNVVDNGLGKSLTSVTSGLYCPQGKSFGLDLNEMPPFPPTCIILAPMLFPYTLKLLIFDCRLDSEQILH